MSERDGTRREVKRFLVVLTAVLNLVLVDAAAKELAAGYLKGAAAFPVIPNVFDPG